ncbi:hypothetical protein [Listeria booriae]|uniref:hypothetical protein n=1 Tax=Listeria booriae TaxID=1552123 RepID=UPI001626D460|nr:hypothetical protein [Listeria booriae]MBC1233917.1 hypothetical protein [Listeria booriae]MBC1246165.1 hypothetical protein [Listeria booriae]
MNFQQLKKMNQDVIYEVYTNMESSEFFYVGYIQKVFNEFIVLESYSECGTFDGFRIIDVARIFKIQAGTQYLERYRNSPRVSEQLPQFEDGKDILLEFIEWGKTQNKLVEFIMAWDEKIIGTVVSIDEGILAIDSILDTNFKPDGRCFFEYEDIIEVGLDTNYLKLSTGDIT